MSVVLLILKIIGIVLLALLGLILVLLLLVLFVPVRYRISGVIGEDTSVHVCVTWLLHLVTWKAAYAGGAFESCLRILGIRIGLKKTGDADEEEALDPEPDADTEDAPGIEDKPERSREPKPDMKPETPAGITDRGEEGRTEAVQTELTGAGPGKEAEEPVKQADDSDRQQKEGIFRRIKSFFAGIKSRYIRFKSALPGIKDRFSDIKSLILDENNKIVLSGALAELQYLLSHFKFRKIDADLRFSLGDPAATGQALGVLSMMPFLYRYQFRIYPDFEAEEAYIRGNFAVKGRARAVHGVVSLLRLIRKKEVRALIKKLLDNK